MNCGKKKKNKILECRHHRRVCTMVCMRERCNNAYICEECLDLTHKGHSSKKFETICDQEMQDRPMFIRSSIRTIEKLYANSTNSEIYKLQQDLRVVEQNINSFYADLMGRVQKKLEIEKMKEIDLIHEGIAALRELELRKWDKIEKFRMEIEDLLEEIPKLEEMKEKEDFHNLGELLRRLDEEKSLIEKQLPFIDDNYFNMLSEGIVTQLRHRIIDEERWEELYEGIKDIGKLARKSIEEQYEDLSSKLSTLLTLNPSIILGDVYGKVYLFDIEKESSAHLFSGKSGSCQVVSQISPWEFALGFSSKTPLIYIYNVLLTQVTQTISAHSKDIIGIEKLNHSDSHGSGSGTPPLKFISCSADGVMKIWSRGEEEWKEEGMLGDGKGINCIGVVGEGKVATGSKEGVKVWELHTGGLDRVYVDKHEKNVKGLILLLDASLLACTNAGNLQRWELDTGKLTKIPNMNAISYNQSHNLLQMEDGKILVITDYKNIRIYSPQLDNYQLIHASKEMITMIGIISDSEVLVASQDKTLTVWDIDLLHLKTTYPLQTWALDFKLIDF